MFNSIHEECGVFGIFEPKPKMVGDTTYLGLCALQQRGQEACGLAVCEDGRTGREGDEGTWWWLWERGC